MEPVQAGGVPWRRASPFSVKDLEGLPRPAVRGEESTGRAPVRDRRRRGDPGRRGTGGDLLPGCMPTPRLCRGSRLPALIGCDDAGVLRRLAGAGVGIVRG